MSRRTERITDGRVTRRLENHLRIVEALFSLLQEGTPHPTLKQIAAEAGVTPRTLLNHFPDLGSLLLATVRRGQELASVDFPALPHEPDPEVRIHKFCLATADFFDVHAAIRWASLTFPGELRGFDPEQRKSPVLRMVEERMLELLIGLAPNAEIDSDLRAAVRVVIDPLSWRLLRTQQKLPRAAAAASMARGLIALGREAGRLADSSKAGVASAGG